VSLILGGFGQDGLLISLSKLRRDETVIAVDRKDLDEIRIDSKYKEEIINEIRLYRKNGKYIDFRVEKSEEIKPILRKIEPTHIFHLASVNGPDQMIPEDKSSQERSFDVSVNLTKHLIHHLKSNRDTKLFFAGSSKMFTVKPGINKIHENSELNIHSKDHYTSNKILAHKALISARDEYGLKVNTLLLFNHESILRNRNFLSRKISIQFASIIAGKIPKSITLRNSNIHLDVSSALDITNEIIKYSNLDVSRDIIFSQGKKTSIHGTILELIDHFNLEDVKIIDLDENQNCDQERIIIGDITNLNKLTTWKGGTSFKSVLIQMILEELRSI
jgi:GDPmannose 4,6-dehydratase